MGITQRKKEKNRAIGARERGRGRTDLTILHDLEKGGRGRKKSTKAGGGKVMLMARDGVTESLSGEGPAVGMGGPSHFLSQRVSNRPKRRSGVWKGPAASAWAGSESARSAVTLFPSPREKSKAAGKKLKKGSIGDHVRSCTGVLSGEWLVIGFWRTSGPKDDFGGVGAAGGRLKTSR